MISIGSKFFCEKYSNNDMSMALSITGLPGGYAVITVTELPKTSLHEYCNIAI